MRKLFHAYWHKEARKFLDILETASFTKVMKMVNFLETYGWALQMPYSKSLGNSLHELRIPGKENIRVIYTSFKDEYYLLSAFKKTKNKIPKKELDLAQSRLKNINRLDYV